jgi:iron-sulfur cluster repair protein YtfE (RIC family)
MPDRHGRMDSKLAALDTCVRAGDHAGAIRQFIAFDADLTRYARGEEQLLFPVIDRFTSVPPSATAHMRSEHRSLRRLVDTLGTLLARDDAPRALDLLGTLRSVLLFHLAKEEWVLAPVMR